MVQGITRHGLESRGSACPAWPARPWEQVPSAGCEPPRKVSTVGAWAGVEPWGPFRVPEELPGQNLPGTPCFGDFFPGVPGGQGAGLAQLPKTAVSTWEDAVPSG